MRRFHLVLSSWNTGITFPEIHTAHATALLVITPNDAIIEHQSSRFFALIARKTLLRAAVVSYYSHLQHLRKTCQKVMSYHHPARHFGGCQNGTHAFYLASATFSSALTQLTPLYHSLYPTYPSLNSGSVALIPARPAAEAIASYCCRR